MEEAGEVGSEETEPCELGAGLEVVLQAAGVVGILDSVLVAWEAVSDSRLMGGVSGPIVAARRDSLRLWRGMLILVRKETR